MLIIEVNHVTKEYRLGQLQSLKHSLQRAAAKLRGQPLPERPLLKALDNVDFKVEAGEVLGIIGHNGAGLIGGLTGRENVFLNGAILGDTLTRHQPTPIR